MVIGLTVIFRFSTAAFGDAHGDRLKAGKMSWDEIRVPAWIKKRLKGFRPVVLRKLWNGSRYWIGDSAQAHLMWRNAKLSPYLRTLAAGGWQKDPRAKLTSTELPQTPRRCHKDGSGDEWLDLHSVAKVGQTFD